jgi:hypothetical protein
MANHTNHRLVYTAFLAAVFALAGCGKSSKESPPKQQVQDTVAAVLPPFLTLLSIELEPISTGPESVKVNFKAITAPKEDLFQVDREVEGTPKVTLLKMVQASGAKLTLYGFVKASLTMDKWTLESPQIQIGLNQFGTTRGTFDAQSYVTDSSEAKVALKQQATNAELQQQAKKAAFEQEERERIAREEQRAREEQSLKEKQEQARIAFNEQQRQEAEKQKAEEDAVREKLLLATAPGKRYIGTITNGDDRRRIHVVFTEQKGALISVEVSNPDNASEKRIFKGEVVSKPQQPDKNKPELDYPIMMSPVNSDYEPLGGRHISKDRNWYYFYHVAAVPLKLRLSDSGLEGIAKAWSFTFTIHLQRQ